MSRIGRAPIEIPNGVTVDQTTNGDVIVTGPKGTLRTYVDSCITLTKNEQEGKTIVTLTRANDDNIW